VLLDQFRLRLHPEMAWLTNVGTLSGEQARVIFAPKKRQKKRASRANFFMGDELTGLTRHSVFDQSLFFIDEYLNFTGLLAFIIRHENSHLRCIIRGVRGLLFLLGGQTASHGQPGINSPRFKTYSGSRQKKEMEEYIC
jgi:hypothetical protein